MILIVAHPLLSDLRWPRLELRADLPVSDEFRAEFNGWLLETFGDEERAFVIPNQRTAFISPEMFALIRMKK